jgi:hypothetical protein
VVGRFPDFADARVMLAIAQLDRKQGGAAIAELRAVLFLAPASTLAHYHLATALGRTEQRVEVDAHLRRAHALDPRLGALAAPPEGTPRDGNPLPGTGTGATQWAGAMPTGKTR